jgi:hypothetical protein
MTCHRHKSIATFSRLAAVVLAAWLQACGFARATEAPQIIILELDRAKLVSLPKEPRQIVIDNPLIAHVTQLTDGSHAVLTGTAFGETTMAVLDSTGAVLLESSIRVKEPSDSGVTVYRGLERTSYFDCVRQCQPGLKLGDNPKDFADIGSQIRGREAKADAPHMEGGRGL